MNDRMPRSTGSAAGMMTTILADDLTGALDTGAALRNTGFRVLVGWETPERAEGAVFVLDTHTRNLERQEASRSVARSMHDRVVYLKIDSTLRGHVGVSVQAALEHGPYEAALVCPALISQGRTVVSGRLRVWGEPLHLTDLGRDPMGGAATDHIEVIVRRHTNLTTRTLTPEQTEAIPELSRRGVKVFVGDAACLEDMHIWAQAVSRYRLLPVGSAGLLAAMDLRMVPSMPQPALPIPRGTLILNGSPSAHNRRQIETLLHLHPEVVYCPITLPVEAEEMHEAVDRAQQALDQGGCALIDAAVTARASITTAGMQYRMDADRLRFAIQQAADGITGVSRLVICGGDTAHAVLRGAGTQALELGFELEAQIPVSRAIGGHFDGCEVVTKAGAFGGLDLFARLLEESGSAGT